MLTTKEQQTNITLSCRDLILCILGDDAEGKGHSTIPHNVALTLDKVLAESKSWKVEFNDHEGKPLVAPQLWRYSEWNTELTTYLRRKKYAHEERVARFIHDKNINNMAHKIMRSTGLPYDKAVPVALTLVNSGDENLMKAMGLDKIIKEESEL